MTSEMKKNAILIFCNSDGDLDSFDLMTYEEAYELMKKEAVRDWLANENYTNIDKLVENRDYVEARINDIYTSGLLVSEYAARVYNSDENSWNYKIITI